MLTGALWTFAEQLIEESRRIAGEFRTALTKIEMSITMTSLGIEGLTGTVTFFGDTFVDLAELQAELRRRGRIPSFMTSVVIRQR